MKIGIVTSWVDMLILFRFLANYNFEYEIVYDDLGRPWADKPVEFGMERAKQAVAYLQKQGVEKIILPPVLELALHHEKKYADVVLPLRQGYAEKALAKSPVGKIGFAGEYADIQQKELFETFCQSYQPNETQLQRAAELAQKRKGHKRGVSFWRKEIFMWKYYLTKLSFKSWQIHHAMKADWKYFKDAGVDTIIPVSYGFFTYEVPLGKFLNTKKQRFHRLALVEEQFHALTKNLSQTSYGVHIAYTGTLDHLTREKKRMWMLQKGKDISISSEKISLL